MRVVLETHDNKEYVENIEGFDLAQFINEVNSETHKMIIFGGVGISKNLIKVVNTNPIVADDSPVQ